MGARSSWQERMYIQPPQALLKVFPRLLKWQAVRFRARLSKKDWSEGGLDEYNLTGQGCKDHGGRPRHLAVLLVGILVILLVLTQQCAKYL